MKTYQVTIGYYTRQVTKEFTTTVQASSKSAALGEAVHQLLADGYAIIGLEYIDIKKINDQAVFTCQLNDEPSSEQLAEMSAMFERAFDPVIPLTYMWGDLT